jgi:acyl dehydratase
MAYKYRGRRYEEFAVGDRFTTPSRTVTEADVINFAGLSGDYNPLHTNEEFAKTSSFKRRTAHGLLTASIAQGLINQLGLFDGTLITYVSMNLRYTGVVMFGDTIRAQLKVMEKKEAKKVDRGMVAFQVEVLNHMNHQLMEGEWVFMVIRGG